MSADTLIKVENVSKKFCRSLKRSMWYGVQDLGNEVRGRRHGGNGELRTEEFWAVNDVSFELKRGECLGLIGRNGAGKTTLLRMLNGLIKPDAGRIEMRGRVSALIALGAGFSPVLTGRENIFAAGAMIGMTTQEIESKFDGIVDFSGLADSIDMPVQSYSSGMQVRLGFSIAAQLEPDILLLDEVLAVGDVGFSTKSLNRVLDVMQNSAVIFVSHHMVQVARVSSKVLMLEKGRKSLYTDNVPEAIDHYFAGFAATTGKLIVADEAKGATIHKIQLYSDDIEVRDVIEYGKTLTVRIAITLPKSIEAPSFGISIFSKDHQIISQTISSFSPEGGFAIVNQGEAMRLAIDFGNLYLNPGQYRLSLGVGETESTHSGLGKTLIRYDYFRTLRVAGPKSAYAPFLLPAKWKIEEPHEVKDS